ncbi:F-box domain containing protein [Pandoravirus japonicus]|uniref:F-box domain containing protein n=1 Tax=Pandoravirus japonicus TaxID=2823154 RepID=A0A811BLG3_9VIRU|nr:F-box domain containing protein [Pandoravirus japonicus]
MRTDSQMPSLGWRRKKARIAATPHARRTEEVPPRSARDALPDEVICLVLEACAQRDIGALAQTCRRMRRLCMDDTLWRCVYLCDFPPCRDVCLWVLGNEVDRLPVSLLDHVRHWLGRALDRDDDLSAVDPVDARVAQGIEHLTGASVEGVSRCVHHWPAVIQSRGHRWACASMVALDDGMATRRRFHANYTSGAPGVIVGFCTVQAPYTSTTPRTAAIEKKTGQTTARSIRPPTAAGRRARRRFCRARLGD